MRYFNYGSMQDEAVRDAHYTVAVKGIGGNKLGTLKKDVGDAGLGVRTDISYVQTTIKQGTWGWVAPPSLAEQNAKPGKAAGLLCVNERGSYSGTRVYWYQIGVASDGLAFAELGWRTTERAGAMLMEYPDIAFTDKMDLKMVPKGDTIEFYFGGEKKTLTWDPTSNDWNAGAGAPKLPNGKYDYWNDMSKLVSINLQIEAYWSRSSASSKGNKMELPGTRSDPFVFGPTEYESKTLGPRTIPGRDFKRSSSDPNFSRKLKGNQVEMYSIKNSEKEPK